MNDLLQLGSAIYNKLSSSGTIATYYQKAPQSATVPYCLIYFVTANDDYHFGEKGLNADYQVKVISDRNFPDQGVRLYGGIHDILQDANLTLPGYDVLKIRRESIFQYEDPSHYWNVGGLYSFDVWQQ